MPRTKVLLTLVMIFIVTFAKAQPPYGVNSDLDPSFEARLVINGELETSVFNDYKPDGVHPSATMLTNCSNLASMFIHDAYWQYRYMAENNLTLCQLRASTDPAVADFFLTSNEMSTINSISNVFASDYGTAVGQNTYANLFDMNFFISNYFSKAMSLKYTKMEIFQDMTGYMDPTDFMVNNPYVSPVPAGQRTVDGLGMNEAARKMNDIFNDANGEMFPSLCYYHGPATPQQAGIKNDIAKLGDFNCFPSPFSDKTQVSYTLTQSGNISLQVMDIAGRTVKTLKNGNMVSGSFTATWDGTGNNSKLAEDGVYFIVLQSSTARKVAKVLISR